MSIIRDCEQIERRVQETNIFAALKHPAKLAEGVGAARTECSVPRGYYDSHENIAHRQTKQEQVHVAPSQILKAQKCRAGEYISQENDNPNAAVYDPEEKIQFCAAVSTIDLTTVTLKCGEPWVARQHKS